MPSYAVTFLTGDVQTITADTVDLIEGQYVGTSDGAPVAYIPTDNVLSVVRQENHEAGTG